MQIVQSYITCNLSPGKFFDKLGIHILLTKINRLLRSLFLILIFYHRVINLYFKMYLAWKAIENNVPFTQLSLYVIRY